MIIWPDSLGREWGVDVNIAHNKDFVNLTIYPPKGNYGNTIQMTTSAFKELRIRMCELKVGS